MSVASRCKKHGIKVFGEIEKTSNVKESAHMITFFNSLRTHHPSLGRIATHIRNEGMRTYSQAARQKAEGMVKGASDIIIPGCPAFVCEMKTQSPSATIGDDQIGYLEAAQKEGAFVCVALGWEAAWSALKEWRRVCGER